MLDQEENLPLSEVPVNKPLDQDHDSQEPGKFYCALLERPARIFKPNINKERLQLINLLANKWVSGTVLHYYFFDQKTDGQTVQFTDGSSEWRSWVANKAQREVVEKAFEVWRSVGIGIDFQKVSDREEAEIRIGFMRDDGAWSYLGREILEYGPHERTMNFSWDLTKPGQIDTAIHEIGHTLGFPHEHQNPKSGIEWDEEAVYADLAQPPNEWNRETTFWNIIRKLSAAEVAGTTWDPDSIMHYPFKKGLIRKPVEYAERGLIPAGGLSVKDKSWALSLYPRPAKVMAREEELFPAQSLRLEISAGGQRSFRIRPQESRYYQFQTFGTSDSIMVLFEEDKKELRYRIGDDDSGEDKNAYFRFKLIKGREYVLRIRLYYGERPGETAVMMW